MKEKRKITHHSKKKLRKLKNIFLNKIEKENVINDNKNRELEQFIFDKISEMENIKL